MKLPPKPTPVAQDLAAVRRHYSEAVRNRAMRAEDRWHQLRLNLARRRGQQVTVLSLAGYGSPRWVRIFSRVVMAPDSDFENGRRVAKVIADGVRGWRNFVSAPVPFAALKATVAGREYDVTADRGGIVDTVIDLGENTLDPGWQQITLQAPGEDTTRAEVLIIGDEIEDGIICDIDDTVVVTKLPRPFLAAWNSFVLDEHARTPTPGMAVMMERLMNASPGSPVLYLSTGAWNVAQTLTRFLTRNLYPHGPLLLTDWGPTEDRWFRSGRRHKEQQLERLAGEFPQIKWVLIGDDGQHDPTIYADFVRAHPQNARAVIIRELTYSEAVLAGGRAEVPHEDEQLLRGSGADGAHPPGYQEVDGYRVPWIYGPDGKDISAQLAEHGLLSEGEHPAA
ncbi:App1 family protein [Nesterenkonia alba]|uniref:App1 family protein n=1 Tax=Nesterenkonia alba TaxID=515814 RepID=UPI000414AB74|nr:phosphatase domain-containing protein [Nesterenkonia alba]